VAPGSGLPVELCGFSRRPCLEAADQQNTPALLPAYSFLPTAYCSPPILRPPGLAQNGRCLPPAVYRLRLAFFLIRHAELR
jgi:hypothetical protein